MTETATPSGVERLPLAGELRSLGELRGASVRRWFRVDPPVALAGAAVAAVIVAVGASVAPLDALGLTFVVFLLAGFALGRRPSWSTMLPFARGVVGFLHWAAAGVVVGLAMATTALASAPVWVLGAATVAAAVAAALARRATASAVTRIAVVGSARSADNLRRELLVSGVGDQEVVGVVTAGPAGDAASCGSVAVLGRLAGLAEVLERHQLDVLLLDGAAARMEVFDQLADTCLDLPLRVCELSQFYEDALGHVPVGDIGSAWFRYVMHPRFRSPDTVAKRALDLAVALLAGVAFLPVLALCALLIKLHDGGPVLFRQRRIGSRGREFTLLKLRTMRTAPATVRWSSRDDERVTPVGRLLRRTHLDELPQLINVLRGEMSVVGPRPEQPGFVERLEHTVPHYRRRHLIKPGLTGWAQVRCGYAGSDMGSAWKLCHDLYYLKHQSLGLDLAILTETARTLVADRQFLTRVPQGPAQLVAVATDEGAGLRTAEPVAGRLS